MFLKNYTSGTLQVFLPYVYDGRRTYWQMVQESGFKGLLPEKAS